ncbi:MAG: P-II family nitrogen regulator [Bacillota bacterium]
MENSPDKKEFELLCIIVNFGLGSKVMRIAKQNGVTGGTVFLGKGTVKNRLLEFLDLCDIRKEIVIMISEKTIAYQALDALNKKLHLQKPHHGIAFTTSVTSFLGSKFGSKCGLNSNIKESRGVENTMYHAIFVVVDKGKAESVIEAATKMGSKGGTIINARGSGIHETQKLFSMAIEPEKEMVMILSENHLTDQIVSSIRDDLKIDEPGKGIIFILDVNKTYGIY